MAGIITSSVHLHRPPSSPTFCFSPLAASRSHGNMRCCCTSSSPDGGGTSGKYGNDQDTPRILKIAVSGVTELLRILSPVANRRSEGRAREKIDEIPVSGIDDIVSILKSDYEKAYFVTASCWFRETGLTQFSSNWKQEFSLLESMRKTVYLKIRL